MNHSPSDTQREAHDHCHTPSAPSDAQQELIIEGAGCASCVGKIEATLKKVPGVENAGMNFAQRTVTVITARCKCTVDN